MSGDIRVKTLVRSLHPGVAALVVVLASGCPVLASEVPATGSPADALDQFCEMPVLATRIPDGQVATEAEMVEAQGAVRHFDASITAYNLCLVEAELRHATLNPESAQGLSSARTERNNAAVERAEQAAAAFNAQLAVFRKRGYRPARLRQPATPRDRAYCNRANRPETTVNVELNLSESGEVLEIAMPLGVRADDQTTVRCLVRRMAFDAAIRDGIAEPSQLGLAIPIGGDAGFLATGAEPAAFTASPGSQNGLEPRAQLDRVCTLPQPSGELRSPVIRIVADLATNQSAVQSFDAALADYALCLAGAETALAERDPGHATALGDARTQRHEAAVELGEQIAEQSRQARLAYRGRTFTPPLLTKSPLEYEAKLCGEKIANVPDLGRWWNPEYFLFPTTLVVRISAAGKIIGISFPPGTSSGNISAMQCIVARAQFSPATLDGHAVAGSLPVSVSMSNFGTGMKIGPPAQPPALVSGPEKIDAAYDQCIPADLREEGDVRLLLTVGRHGRVEGARVAASDGSAAVDRAASCIARKLTYQPGSFDGEIRTMEGVALSLRIAPRSDGRLPSTKPY